MIDELCTQLRERTSELDARGTWPAEQLQLCAQHHVYRWFVPFEFSGFQWNDRQQLEGYLALSRSCLVSAFVLTQWNAACRRIVASSNQVLRSRLLPSMADGQLFVTVGISQLTTSRQHLTTPAVHARALPDGGFQLSGVTPWVTGAFAAKWIVIGATLENQDQLLCCVPTDRQGVECGPGLKLLALSASCTDEVRLTNVCVSADEVLAGPCPHVLQSGSSMAAGGLQTSALAIGLAHAAIDYLSEESEKRPDLIPIAHKLDHDATLLEKQLLALADGENPVHPGEMRHQANSLALRATQAALGSAKGSGFLQNHPTGRWAREALFFLVWSCPQPVLNASLCELAQLS